MGAMKELLDDSPRVSSVDRYHLLAAAISASRGWSVLHPTLPMLLQDYGVPTYWADDISVLEFEWRIELALVVFHMTPEGDLAAVARVLTTGAP